VSISSCSFPAHLLQARCLQLGDVCQLALPLSTAFLPTSRRGSDLVFLVHTLFLVIPFRCPGFSSPFFSPDLSVTGSESSLATNDVESYSPTDAQELSCSPHVFSPDVSSRLFFFAPLFGTGFFNRCRMMPSAAFL